MNRKMDFQAFAGLVEETFDRPLGSISDCTRCDEVPGWDSLGHSVLLSRLSKRYRLVLAEADATMDGTVGELHSRMAALQEATAG